VDSAAKCPRASKSHRYPALATKMCSEATYCLRGWTWLHRVQPRTSLREPSCDCDSTGQHNKRGLACGFGRSLQRQARRTRGTKQLSAPLFSANSDIWKISLSLSLSFSFLLILRQIAVLQKKKKNCSTRNRDNGTAAES